MLNKFFCLLFLYLSMNISYAKTAEECTVIKPPLLRLSCFDNVFETPVYRDEKKLTTIKKNKNLPASVRKIFDFQEKNNDDDMSVFQSGETVKIVIKPLVSNSFSSSLFLDCVDNITNFQIALKKPLKEKQLLAKIVDTNSGKVLLSEQWQVLEKGYLLDIGRGLFAIEKIKRLLKSNQITYVIPSLKYSWNFNIENLNAEIKPLRKSCGW